MINLLLINKVILFLINIVGLWLALWVYLANRKDRINQLFFLVTIFILSWITLVYFASISTSQSQAIFLSRAAFIPVYLFLISVYFFTAFFPRKEKRYLFLDIIVLIAGATLSLITVFTDFHVKSVVSKEWGISPVLGEGVVFIYSIIFLITVLFSARILRKYFRLPKEEKLKVQYFLVGFFIFVIANIIFNVFLSTKYADFPYYLIGNYSAIFLLGFTGYAIGKQELFGIKVVITAIFVALTAISLALDALVFTDVLILQLFKGLILAVFLYLGYLLIRSVMREIRQREQIEKLSKAKSEFISIASHQLRTPLTAIKGYISMILEGTYGRTPPKVREPMKKVYISNERLINLVNNLLSISRIESGKMGIDFEKVSIEGLISGIIDMFGIEAEKKSIFLKFEKPKKPLPEISIDKEKITDVISNIVSNCIKYTEKGGITVKVKKLSHRSKPGEKRILPKLRIVVSDTGEGMTKEELSKVFQSFSRGMAGTKLYTEGAGLGLYVARKYMEMHKGKIWAESAGKDKGSTFYIELPMK